MTEREQVGLACEQITRARRAVEDLYDAESKRPPERQLRALELAGIMHELNDCRRQLLEDRKSTRLNSSHIQKSRMPSSA